MWYQESEALLCLVVGLLVLMHLAFIIGWPRPRAWMQALGSLRSGVAARIRLATSKGEPDTLSDESRRLIAERKRNLFASMYSFSWTIVGCSGWLFFVRALMVWEWPPAHASLRYALTQGVLTVLKVRPDLLTTRSLGIWYSFLMCSQCIVASPLPINKSPEVLLLSTRVGIQVVMTAVAPNLPLVFVWNLLHALASLGSYVFFYDELVAVTSFSRFLTSELAMSILLCGLHHAFSMSFRGNILNEIVARRAEDERSMVMSLLNTMSDAVVELDADLHIMGESRKLSCLLLHDTGRSTRGVYFPNLAFSEDDAVHLTENLSPGTSHSGELAHVFHSRMRDPLGSCIKTEMFHVCKRGDDMRPLTHIIGISESSDGDRLGGDQPGALLSEDQSAANQASSAIEVHPDLDDGPSVTFHATTTDIIGVSSSFVSLLGRNPGEANFERWIVGKARVKFRTHYERMYNHWISTGNSLQMEFKGLPLEVPLNASSALRFQADCTIVFGLSSDGDGDGDEDHSEASRESEESEDEETPSKAILCNIKGMKAVFLKPDHDRSSQSRGSSMSRASSSSSSSSNLGRFNDAAPGGEVLARVIGAQTESL